MYITALLVAARIYRLLKKRFKKVNQIIWNVERKKRKREGRERERGGGEGKGEREAYSTNYNL